MPENGLMTLEETAGVLGITPSQVEILITMEELQMIHPTPDTRGISEKSVMKYIIRLAEADKKTGGIPTRGGRDSRLIQPRKSL